MSDSHALYESVDPTLKWYLSEISNIPLLTPEEEKELAIKIREGDLDALKKLVVSNLRFVVSIAKNYSHCCHELDFLDLISEGNKGLIEAAKRFDPQRNIRFISYAVWWIRQAILQAITEKCGVIRIPSKHFNLIRKMRLAYRDYEQKHGEKPSLEHIAEAMDMNIKDVEKTMKLFLSPVSLESPIGDDEGKRLGDVLSIDDVLEPDRVVILDSLKTELCKLLDKLTPREKQIIQMRFGLTGDAPCTLEAIGKQMGISRERVRQIEEKAKKKLRVWARKRNLTDYLN